MTIPHHDVIALRAYFIWEGEGRPHGRHEAHWFAAQVAETLAAPEVRASQPVTAEAAPAPKAAPAKAARKAAAAKAAPAKATAPKASTETVVAAAALKAPRAARTAGKGARGAH